MTLEDIKSNIRDFIQQHKLPYVYRDDQNITKFAEWVRDASLRNGEIDPDAVAINFENACKDIYGSTGGAIMANGPVSRLPQEALNEIMAKSSAGTDNLYVDMFRADKQTQMQITEQLHDIAFGWANIGKWRITEYDGVWYLAVEDGAKYTITTRLNVNKSTYKTTLKGRGNNFTPVPFDPNAYNNPEAVGYKSGSSKPKKKKSREERYKEAEKNALEEIRRIAYHPIIFPGTDTAEYKQKNAPWFAKEASRAMANFAETANYARGINPRGYGAKPEEVVKASSSLLGSALRRDSFIRQARAISNINIDQPTISELFRQGLQQTPSNITSEIPGDFSALLSSILASSPSGGIFYTPSIAKGDWIDHGEKTFRIDPLASPTSSLLSPGSTSSPDGRFNFSDAFISASGTAPGNGGGADNSVIPPLPPNIPTGSAGASGGGGGTPPTATASPAPEDDGDDRLRSTSGFGVESERREGEGTDIPTSILDGIIADAPNSAVQPKPQKEEKSWLDDLIDKITGTADLSDAIKAFDKIIKAKNNRTDISDNKEFWEKAAIAANNIIDKYSRLTNDSTWRSDEKQQKKINEVADFLNKANRKVEELAKAQSSEEQVQGGGEAKQEATQTLTELVDTVEKTENEVKGEEQNETAGNSVIETPNGEPALERTEIVKGLFWNPNTQKMELSDSYKDYADKLKPLDLAQFADIGAKLPPIVLENAPRTKQEQTKLFQHEALVGTGYDKILYALYVNAKKQGNQAALKQIEENINKIYSLTPSQLPFYDASRDVFSDEYGKTTASPTSETPNSVVSSVVSANGESNIPASTNGPSAVDATSYNPDIETAIEELLGKEEYKNVLAHSGLDYKDGVIAFLDEQTAGAFANFFEQDKNREKEEEAWKVTMAPLQGALTQEQWEDFSYRYTPLLMSAALKHGQNPKGKQTAIIQSFIADLVKVYKERITRQIPEAENQTVVPPASGEQSPAINENENQPMQPTPTGDGPTTASPSAPITTGIWDAKYANYITGIEEWLQQQGLMYKDDKIVFDPGGIADDKVWFLNKKSALVDKRREEMHTHLGAFFESRGVSKKRADDFFAKYSDLVDNTLAYEIMSKVDETQVPYADKSRSVLNDLGQLWAEKPDANVVASNVANETIPTGQDPKAWNDKLDATILKDDNWLERQGLAYEDGKIIFKTTKADGNRTLLNQNRDKVDKRRQAYLESLTSYFGSHGAPDGAAYEFFSAYSPLIDTAMALSIKGKHDGLATADAKEATNKLAELKNLWGERYTSSITPVDSSNQTISPGQETSPVLVPFETPKPTRPSIISRVRRPFTRATREKRREKKDVKKREKDRKKNAKRLMKSSKRVGKTGTELELNKTYKDVVRPSLDPRGDIHSIFKDWDVEGGLRREHSTVGYEGLSRAWGKVHVSRDEETKELVANTEELKEKMAASRLFSGEYKDTKGNDKTLDLLNSIVAHAGEQRKRGDFSAFSNMMSDSRATLQLLAKGYAGASPAYLSRALKARGQGGRPEYIRPITETLGLARDDDAGVGFVNALFTMRDYLHQSPAEQLATRTEQGVANGVMADLPQGGVHPIRWLKSKFGFATPNRQRVHLSDKDRQKYAQELAAQVSNFVSTEKVMINGVETLSTVYDEDKAQKAQKEGKISDEAYEYVRSHGTRGAAIIEQYGARRKLESRLGSGGFARAVGGISKFIASLLGLTTSLTKLTYTHLKSFALKIDETTRSLTSYNGKLGALEGWRQARDFQRKTKHAEETAEARINIASAIEDAKDAWADLVAVFLNNGAADAVVTFTEALTSLLKVLKGEEGDEGKVGSGTGKDSGKLVYGDSASSAAGKSLGGWGGLLLMRHQLYDNQAPAVEEEEAYGDREGYRKFGEVKQDSFMERWDHYNDQYRSSTGEEPGNLRTGWNMIRAGLAGLAPMGKYEKQNRELFNEAAEKDMRATMNMTEVFLKKTKDKAGSGELSPDDLFKEYFGQTEFGRLGLSAEQTTAAINSTEGGLDAVLGALETVKHGTEGEFFGTSLKEGANMEQLHKAITVLANVFGKNDAYLKKIMEASEKTAENTSKTEQAQGQDIFKAMLAFARRGAQPGGNNHARDFANESWDGSGDKQYGRWAESGKTYIIRGR